jgi:hypothetical protein
MKQELPTDWFEQLKSEYPKRYGGQGWAAVRRLIPARLSEGASWDELLNGTKAYAKFCVHTGKTGTELVKQARTFYGRDCWFSEDYEVPETNFTPRKPEVITDEQRQEDIRKFHEDLKRLKVVK